MKNSAATQTVLQPWLEYGTVRCVDDENNNAFIVNTTAGDIRSEPAASCLLCPQAGDAVLLSIDMAGVSYILSVLKRPDHQTAKNQLHFQGNVDIHVADGSLNISTDHDVSMAADRKITLASTALSLYADRGEAVIDKLSHVGRKFVSRVQRISIVAQTVENTVRRLTQRLHNAFRFVKEHEEIQTGSTRYLVEDTLTMHTKNTVQMAEEVITINAEQVHLG